MPAPTLLAYPNVSEGRDRAAIDRIGRAFGDALVDVHSDVDHHRSAYTLAGAPGQLAQAVTRGAKEAVKAIRIDTHEGVHPRVGAVDVAPIIYLSDADRGAAAAEALVLADMLGTELALPVFLYGVLAGGRTRAELRRGGPAELQRRIDAAELRPDFGPAGLHPTAGAVLVAARPPLVAFNVELAAPATVEDARDIAAHIRESGDEGLPGLRAIGLWLAETGLAQVSTNVEDHRATPLRAVVEAVARHAPVHGAELVGPRSRGRLRSIPAGHPASWVRDDRTNPSPPRAQRVSSHSPMAQTKRKRRTKHRGNAAGTIEVRGRTGRPPTPEERKKQERAKRTQARTPKPPTWNSAIKKALLATAFIFVFLLVTNKFKVVPALVFAVLAMLLYIPSGYYLDGFLYRRYQRKQLQKQ